MSAHPLFCNAFAVLIFFMLPNISISDDSHLRSPTISFSWVDYIQNYKAGDTAGIRVTVLKDFKTKEDRLSFSPNVSMNDVTGNSSIITGLRFDRNDWRIYFVPIMVGKFNVLITETHFNIMDASKQLIVTPGPLYELGGLVSWVDQMNDFVAGSKATVSILPKDAFGNNVTKPSGFNLQFFATYLDGSNVKLLYASLKGWKEYDYLYLEFIPATAGNFLIHVKHRNYPLVNSPLPFTVHPEALEVANCSAHWSHETNYFQLFSTMETFVSQRDKFGNLVPGLYQFDIEVMEKGSKLTFPIDDIQHKEVSPGIQSFSFKVIKPGDFILIISDRNKTKIMNMPYEFSVYIGYCDDRQSIVNGSGLNDSVAGDVSKFSISLKDAYQYPSPVELERLQVRIRVPSLSLHVNSQIYPKDYNNGTRPSVMLSYDTFGPTGMTYDPFVFSHENSDENSKTRNSDFEVVYVPEKSGVYEIRIFCGNIPLNGGHPFIKEVSAGAVNLSLSGIIKYDKIAPGGIINYFSLQLVDSFYNPVSSQEKNLHVHMYAKEGRATVNPCNMEDMSNGTYLGCYYAPIIKYYEICIAYLGRRVQPWPIGIDVIDEKKFPYTRNTSVNVWEDQSTAFYPLEDDYFVGDAKFLQFQRPSHGSILQYGTLFRYTPYKRFYGYDKFIYTISDANGHNATGHVDINVVTIAPQFVSSPAQLLAVEDTLSPQFGGFPSFEILYSVPLENISVILTAQNGTVFLSPFLTQLWDPMWNELSVIKVEGNNEFLNLTGYLDVINFALKSLQYIGNANFSGNDIISITTINIYDKGYLDVPIFVEPINDPPIINVPKFIILDKEKDNKGFLIFERDKFNVSIEDPDRFSFPGNEETHFRVMFSVEVSSGTLSAKLPAQLISTTELKFKTSKQWQPLVAFVEISKHFTVNKVKGLRFRGTINECNTLLHQLIYYGDKHDGALKVHVNDMGWYGCYPDCSEMMSVPLISEATVNLITRTPMNSLVAHSLGLVLVIESILLTSMAVILMFFTCKCVIVIVRDKKKLKEAQNFQPSEDEEMPGETSPDNTIQLTGNDLSSSGQSEQPSNLPKPAEETNAGEVPAINLTEETNAAEVPAINLQSPG